MITPNCRATLSVHKTSKDIAHYTFHAGVLHFGIDRCMGSEHGDMNNYAIALNIVLKQTADRFTYEWNRTAHG